MGGNSSRNKKKNRTQKTRHPKNTHDIDGGVSGKIELPTDAYVHMRKKRKKREKQKENNIQSPVTLYTQPPLQSFIYKKARGPQGYNLYISNC